MLSRNNLIIHYNIFYATEDSTLETFLEWCTQNDCANARTKFLEDIKDNDIEVEDSLLFTSSLVIMAGIIADAYETMRYNYKSESFYNFYEKYKNNKAIDSLYAHTFKTIMSDDLLKQINKRFFRKSVDKLNKLHALNILNKTQQAYGVINDNNS